jgi:hypothetical protein
VCYNHSVCYLFSSAFGQTVISYSQEGEGYGV